MFVTYTYNQVKHFGAYIIKNWIDSNKQTKYYPNINDLQQLEQREMKQAIAEAATLLLLRNCMETRMLFLEYLYDNSISPYAQVDAMQTRDEYQDFVISLPHIHLIKYIDVQCLVSTRLKLQ